MTRIGERILRKFCRDPVETDYTNDHYELKHVDVDVYIRSLQGDFPRLQSAIANKSVLDIGCAEGLETLALARMGAKEVHGIDIRHDLEGGRAIQEQNPEFNLTFSIMDGENTSFADNEFDAVMTCGSFEHFDDPHAVLKECKRVVKADGSIYVTSGVWSHPWGAHMNFFTMVPWVQFIFSERTIMNVRKAYRDDGATRFSDVEGGLNKVGVRSFMGIVEDLDLTVKHLTLVPVKGLTPLTKVPYVQELFTNLIIAVLGK